jgi:head-tail adaptor
MNCKCFSLLAKERVGVYTWSSIIDAYGNLAESWELSRQLHVIVKNPSSQFITLDGQNEVNRRFYIVFRYKKDLDINPATAKMRLQHKRTFYTVKEVLAGDDMDFTIGGVKYLRYLLESVRPDDTVIPEPEEEEEEEEDV